MRKLWESVCRRSNHYYKREKKKKESYYIDSEMPSEFLGDRNLSLIYFLDERQDLKQEETNRSTQILVSQFEDSLLKDSKYLATSLKTSEVLRDYHILCKKDDQRLSPLIKTILFTRSNFTFGNMMVYLVSYMRKRSEVPDVTYGDFIRVAAFIWCDTGVHNVSIWIHCTVYGLYSIDGSLWQVSFTYGFIPSLGQNLAYLSTITLAMKCFPDKRATISGIVTAGLGIGGFFFNELQTLYLNPSNLLPNELAKKGGSYDSLSSTNILFKENYFDQSEVLDRVPDGSYYTDYDCEEKELLDRTEDSSVNHFYKAFGQTFIKNDLLISTTGSIGGIANFLGRFVFGLLMDKTSYKNIMIVSTTVLTFHYLLRFIIQKILVVWPMVSDFAQSFSPFPQSFLLNHPSLKKDMGRILVN
ncbi:unnamed protein product [Lepeophtheirus salmonis]|uniref:(salmon louse) hypothetical protein n=1 Tax=Lepeophtheirus salmonis TaxID=72036 RepID=A0A7R8H6Z0_LEPSM|nr:unnamed protein product [Lepeophtheirus salmonis]CAF2906597.1 unnamed protein product [Lepeophtheirus salmonis]